MEKYISNRN